MKTLPTNIFIIFCAILATKIEDDTMKILVGIAAIIYGITTIINAEKSRK